MHWIKTIFDPRHPVQKADRLRFHQRHRFMLGVSLTPNFSHVLGCLLEGTGAGKLLRLQANAFDNQPIPRPTRRLFAQACGRTSAPYHRSTPPDWSSYLSLREDITQLVAQVVQGLLSQAGQASDRVLAVAFHHSGLCIAPPGQSACTLPLIDAAALALQTGLNVLDQFPLKDRLEGGRGWPISALPLWLLWADRRSPTAFEHRLVLEWNTQLEMTWLPPSDGLDATYPAIEQQAIDGSTDTAERNATTDSPPNNPSVNPSVNPSHDAAEPLDLDPSDTDLTPVVNQVLQQIQRWQRPRHDGLPALPPAHKLRIIVAGDERGSQRLLESLAVALPETVIVACQDHACPAWGCGPLIAGTHGFLHVDQVPANLPWISGTEVPRILGILTPGAASRYRSLLIEMSDYRPPVMTLRDAV